MNIDDVKIIRKKFINDGDWAIDIGETEFLRQLIEKERPTSFVEIGTATGYSSGMICCFLDSVRAKRFSTFDIRDKFPRDETKETGFLINQIYKGTLVKIEKRFKALAIDCAEGGELYDMAFIDANHSHPWTTLDAIALLPRMTGSRTILLHDLNLFRNDPQWRGVGPKILYDQMPEKIRGTGWEYNKYSGAKNIAYFKSPKKAENYTELLAESLMMPWTIREDPFSNHATGVYDNLYERYANYMTMHYGVELRMAFDKALGLHRARLDQVRKLREFAQSAWL